MFQKSNKYLIFGAGFYGQKALEQYGIEGVDYLKISSGSLKKCSIQED